MESSSSPELLRWESLTKRRFDEIDRAEAVVLLTCSPLEVHGPHLPLGADALEGEGLAERMLRFLPERHRERTFLKLPFIYAATDTVPQPGSLYFQPATTMTVLEDLGRTLAAQGFRHVMVSNFHGGPRHFLAIEKACSRVNRRHGIRMISLFSLLISRLTDGTSNLDDVLGELPGVHKPDLDGDTHGGLVETSQLLALHGDWVDPDHKKLPRRTADIWLEEQGMPPRARGANGTGGLRGLLRMIGSQRAAMGFFGENTYSGAPAGASAELGERFLDRLGSEAADACAELLDGAIGPEDCHSPIWKLRFLFLNPLMIRLSNRAIGLRNPIA
jgi:creatinine amidohydrolase/Fe(II)-dependent formamide hydrolase-like protein